MRIRRAAAILTGLGLGVGYGILLPSGEWRAVAATIVLGPPLVLGAVRLDRGGMLAWLMGTSLSLHLGLMALVHFVSDAVGQEGFVTGDEFGYFYLASRLASHLHGEVVPINWSAEGYLIDNYFVQMQTGLFFLFGADLMLAKVLNVAMIHIAAALFFDQTRRLFGIHAARLTFGLILVFPSLTLWSVLNLKESLALLLVAATLWLANRYQDQPQWRWVLGVVVALLLLEGVRRYTFLLLALLFPLAALLTNALNTEIRQRLTNFAATLLLCGGLMAGSGYGFLGLNWLNAPTVTQLEQSRANMGAGARTAIQEPERPVIAQPGDRFIVVAPTQPPADSPPLGATAVPLGKQTSAPASTAAACDPRRSPRVIVVEPNTRLVLATSVTSSDATEEPAPSGVVFVRCNDVIVVAGAAPSTNTPTPLVVGAERQPAPAIRSADYLDPPAVFARSIAYLPRGVVYVVFAPFPWAAQTLAEVVTIPDMLFWYVIAIAAAVGVWMARGDYRRLAIPVLYLLGLLMILVLAEGNVGTLFRHRAMIVPIAIMLGSPVLLSAASQIRRRLNSQ